MIYTTIVYQITNKCNAQCKICCTSSGPHESIKMDKDFILDSIESIKNMGIINNIILTGGEPFLYTEDVLAIAEGCKKINRKFLIATNAYWCKSYSYTKSILSRLKENNLTECLVSTDAFHEEYVPIDCVRLFLRVCRDLGILVRVQTNSTKSTFARTDEIVKKLGMDKMNLSVLYGSSYPVGMAKKNLEQEDFITRKKLEHALCTYENMLFIASNGQINPCCSPCANDIPFDFGNAYNDPIETILNKIKENELMRIITNEGFTRLLNYANKELGFHGSEEYVDICHLCHNLLADADRYSYLQKKSSNWKLKDVASSISW